MLLGNSRASKAVLRFLANSGRFDSLYCTPSDVSGRDKDARAVKTARPAPRSNPRLLKTSQPARWHKKATPRA